MKQSATLARLSKKTVAFLAAATTLLAGLSLATAAPQQANAATRDSYADTIGNPRSKQPVRSTACRRI